MFSVTRSYSSFWGKYYILSKWTIRKKGKKSLTLVFFSRKCTNQNTATSEVNKKRDRRRNLVPVENGFWGLLILICNYILYPSIYSSGSDTGINKCWSIYFNIVAKNFIFKDQRPTISVFTMTCLNAFCIHWFLFLEFRGSEDTLWN